MHRDNFKIIVKIIGLSIIFLMAIVLNNNNYDNYYVLSFPIVALTLLYLITKPHLTLLIFIFCPLYPEIIGKTFNTPLLNDISLYLLLLLLTIGCSRILNKRYPLHSPPLSFVFILYLLIMLVGAIRAPLTVPYLTFGKSLVSNFVKGATVISICWFSYNYFRNNNEKKWINWFFFVIALIISSFYYEKYFYGFSRHAKDFSGFIGNGNTVGNILIISLPLLFYARSQSKTLFSSLIIFLTISVVFLSGSRGSIVALAVMSISYLFFKMKDHFLGRIFTIGIGVLLLISVNSFNLLENIYDPISNIDIETMNDSMVGVHTSGRLSIWSITYKYLQNPGNFIWGGGTNDFMNYSIHNTQNFILKIWVDYGLIGVCLALLLTCRIIKIAIMTKKNEVGTYVIFSTIAMLCCGAFSHFEMGSKQMTPFWVLVGLMLAKGTHLQSQLKGNLVTPKAQQ